MVLTQDLDTFSQFAVPHNCLGHAMKPLASRDSQTIMHKIDVTLTVSTAHNTHMQGAHRRISRGWCPWGSKHVGSSF